MDNKPKAKVRTSCGRRQLADVEVPPPVSPSVAAHPHPKPKKPKTTLSTDSNFVSTSSKSRPAPEECLYATHVLAQIHPDIIDTNNQRREALAQGKMQHLIKSENKKQSTLETPVTDAIISTMLSQNTTDANQRKAFANLKKEFPGGWNDVANDVDTTRIETAIRVAGLAKIRAARIQGMLKTVQQERNDANFEYLQFYDSDEEIQKELSRFKGMGPKTISCVLLFALGRPDFPVDTHVLRITKQIGWIGASHSRESAYEYLNERVPNECKMDLHCLLVTHGKQCYNCAANGKPQFPPKGDEQWKCPLIRMKSRKCIVADSVGSILDIVGSSSNKIKTEKGVDEQSTVKSEGSNAEGRDTAMQPSIKAEVVRSGNLT